MRTIRSFIAIIPWLLVFGLCLWIFRLTQTAKSDTEEYTEQQAVLNSIEAIGKVELVKYNFKEITELKKVSKEYFNLFKLGPDSKIALISTGYAVGCIDLTKIKSEDVMVNDSTITLLLPDPELCYYKLDMEKTKIFSLQTNPLYDEKDFIQKAYKLAERDIKKAAYDANILEQTTQNAEHILKPVLENITGKKIIFSQRPRDLSVPLM